MRDCAVIVLAAGLGTRMKSSKAKVLHEIAGLPMICYPVRAAAKLKLSPIVVVVGHQGDEVESVLRDFLPKSDLRFVKQKEQLGTGHAVKMARKELKDFKGDVLILYGDVPLIEADTLRQFRKLHKKIGGVASVLTMMLEDPAHYGRMILDADRNVDRIVEYRDATRDERRVNEVNSGIYVADCQRLLKAVSSLKNDNDQKEYYLTDAIGKLTKKDRVAAILTDEPEELTGINNRSDLALIIAMIQGMICDFWMKQGVTLRDPASTYIDAQVIIGPDTEVWPNVNLRGRTKVGGNCIIEAGSHVRDGVIAAGVHIKPYSVLEECKVQSGSVIGPFARIRPGTTVGKECKIGNFVELKKVTTGKGTKVSHLTYLGDATIGSDVNIGAGTITCNYDGVNKYQTVIEDGAFIGSDSQFIAPVKIGKQAYVGSGSTITDDVPAKALAVARGRQFVREGYAERFVRLKEEKKKKAKKAAKKTGKKVKAKKKK